MEEQDKRDATVLIRMTKQEKEDMKADGRKLGMGLSEFVRFIWLKFKGH